MDWIKEFPAAITVIDKEGTVIDMNERACATFAAQGGKDIIGTHISLYHKPASMDKINAMLSEGVNNTYTIEKDGKKKLIYQQPWYKDGEIAGLVELSIELPAEMQHFVRS